MNFFSIFKRNLIYKFSKKVSIDTDGFNSDSLNDLFHYYGSDKASFFKKEKRPGHNFSNFYSSKLDNIKKNNINILELGSFAGASAAAFVKYFENSNVFCFDINISNFKFKSKKIHVYGLDINNQKKVKKSLKEIFEKYKFSKFDLIIDDGSHNLSDILVSLKFFFKYLKKESYYIIEDYKHPNYYSRCRDIDDILVDDLFEKIRNKTFFDSKVLSKNDQEELIQSIKSIENFKGRLTDSDISFIKKI